MLIATHNDEDMHTPLLALAVLSWAEVDSQGIIETLSLQLLLSGCLWAFGWD